MQEGGVGTGTIWAALALRLEGLFSNAQKAQQVMTQLEQNMQQAAARASAAASEATAAHSQGSAQALRVEQANWRARIALAGQGTEQQKAILTEYLSWLQGQLARTDLTPGMTIALQNQVAGTIRQLDTLATKAVTVGHTLEATFGRIQRTLTAIIAVEAVRRISTALTELPQLAFQTQAGFHILEKQAVATGQSLDTVHESMGRLAEDLHTVKDALAQPVAELMRYGYTMEQIEGIFRGAAASGLLMGKTIDQSIKLVSEALISQRSVLLNEIGIVENLSTAYTQYAKAIGKTTDDLTAQERAYASYQMIVRATISEVRDLPILMEGYGGATADAGQATFRLKQAVGGALLPAMTELKQQFASFVEVITPTLAAVATLADKAIPALVSVIIYRMVVALQTLQVKMAAATTTTAAFKMVMNPLAGVISAAAAALVYFGLRSIAANRAAEEFGGTAAANATKLEEQARKVKELTDEYSGLIDKPKKSAEENKKLHTVMQDLAKMFPDAVKQWDEHGNAVALDTGKINKNTEALLANAEAQKKAALEAAQKRLQILQEENASLLEQKRIYEELVASIKDATTAEKIRAIEESDLPNYLAIALRYAVAYGQEEKAIASYLAANANAIRDNAAAIAEQEALIDRILGRTKEAATTTVSDPGADGSGKVKTALELFREEASAHQQAIELARVGYGNLIDKLDEYRTFLRGVAGDEKREQEVRAAAARELNGILQEAVQARLDWFERAKGANDPMVDTLEKQINFLEHLLSKEKELQMIAEDRIAIEGVLWQTRNEQFQEETRLNEWNAQQQLDNYKTLVAAHAISVDQRLETEAKLADLTARVSDEAYKAALTSYDMVTAGAELSTKRQQELYQELVVSKLESVKLSAAAEEAIKLQTLAFDRRILQEQQEQAAKTAKAISETDIEALRATGQARAAEYATEKRRHLQRLAELQNTFTSGVLSQTDYTRLAKSEADIYAGNMAKIGLDALTEAFENMQKEAPPSLWEGIFNLYRDTFENVFKADIGLDVIPQFLTTQLDELSQEIKDTAAEKIFEIEQELAHASNAALQAAGDKVKAAMAAEEQRHKEALRNIEQKRKALMLTPGEYQQLLDAEQQQYAANMAAIKVMNTADITLAEALAKAVGDDRDVAKARATLQHANDALSDLIHSGMTGQVVEQAQKEVQKAHEELLRLERGSAIRTLLDEYGKEMAGGPGQVSLAKNMALWFGGSQELAEAKAKLEMTKQLITTLVTTLDVPEESALIEGLLATALGLEEAVDRLSKAATTKADALAAIEKLTESISNSAMHQIDIKVEEGVITGLDATKEKINELENALVSYRANWELAGIAQEDANERIAEMREQLDGLRAQLADNEALYDYILTVKELGEAYEEALGPLMRLEEAMAFANGETFSEAAYMQQFLAQHIRATASAYLTQGKSAEQLQAVLAPLLTLLKEYNDELDEEQRKQARTDFWSGWRGNLASTLAGPLSGALSAGWNAWKITDADADKKLEALGEAFNRILDKSLVLAKDALRWTGDQMINVLTGVGKLTRVFSLDKGSFFSDLKQNIGNALKGVVSLLGNIRLPEGVAEALYPWPEMVATISKGLTSIVRTWSGLLGGFVKSVAPEWMKDVGAVLGRFFGQTLPKILDDQTGNMQKAIANGSLPAYLMEQVSWLLREGFKLDVLLKYLRTEGMFQGAAHAINDLLAGINDALVQDILPLLLSFEPFRVAAHMLGTAVQLGGKAIQSVVDAINSLIDEDTPYYSDMTAAVWGFISNIMGYVSDGLAMIPQALQSALGYVLEGLDFVTAPLQKAFWWIADKVQGLLGNALPFIEAQLDKIQGLDWGKFLGDAAAPVAGIFDELLKASEPLKKVWDTLGRLFQALANVVGDLLLPIFKMLWPVLKGFAWIVAEAALAIGKVWNGIINVFQSIFQWLANLNIFGWRPFAGLQSAADAFGSIKIDTDSIREARDEIGRLTFEEITAGFADSLRSAFKSAFSETSLVEAIQGFSKSLQQTVRDAIVNGFMESAAMKPLFDRLSAAISAAMADGIMSASEWANIQGLSEPIKEQMQRLWEMLKDLGLTEKKSGGGGGSAGLQVTRLTGESRQLFVDIFRPITQLPAHFERIYNRVNEALSRIEPMLQSVSINVQEATVTILRADVLIQSAQSVTLAGPVTLHVPGGSGPTVSGAIRAGV